MACPLCKSTNILDIGSREIILRGEKNNFILGYCASCKFVFLVNRFDYKNFYNSFYFNNYYNPEVLLGDGVQSSLDNDYDNYVELNIKAYDDLFDLISKFGGVVGKKYLDVGCAGGFGLLAAKKRGATVYGVDVSEEAINRCRNKGFENSYVGEMVDLKLVDKMDVVTMRDVLEHMQDPLANLSALNNILNVGGIVLVKNNIFSLKKFIKDKNYFLRYFEPPYHCSYFSEKLILRMFDMAGFKLIYKRPFIFDYIFDFYALLYKMFRKKHKQSRRVEKDLILSNNKVGNTKGRLASRMGRWLNCKYPSGYLFKKVR